MSLLPASSFQLLSGLCRSTIGVGSAVVSVGAALSRPCRSTFGVDGAVVSVGGALSPPLILFSETGSGSITFFEARSIAVTNRVVVIGCGDSRALYICDDHGFLAELSRQLI